MKKYLINSTNHLKLLLVFACVFGAFSDTSLGQSEETVVVTSWKKGNSRIIERELFVDLQDTTDRFAIDLRGEEGDKLYRFELRKTFVKTIRTPSTQCWAVSLNELFFDSKTSGYVVGGDLLGEEGPRIWNTLTTLANVLCPFDKPSRPLDRNHYPAKRLRRFLIEKFVLEIKLKDFKYDAEKIRLGDSAFEIKLKNTF